MVKEYSNEHKPLLYEIGLKYPNWMQILDRGCLTGLGKDCLPVSKQSENLFPFPGRQPIISPVAFSFRNCTHAVHIFGENSSEQRCLSPSCSPVWLTWISSLDST